MAASWLTVTSKVSLKSILSQAKIVSLNIIIAVVFITYAPSALAQADVGKAEIVQSNWHAGPLEAIVFSPDGKFILTTSSRDRSARLWEVKSGRKIRQFDHQKGKVTAIAFSPIEPIAVTGSDDQSIRVWDIATGRVLREFAGHHAYAIAFSPDGRFLIAGGETSDGQA